MAALARLVGQVVWLVLFLQICSQDGIIESVIGSNVLAIFN